MGLLNCASGASAWRGYDYFKENKVKRLTQIGETQYCAEVSGSNGKSYDVLIDTAHPRKSKCNCPHADGRKIVCKHMIASYFTAFPEEAERFYADIIARQEEEEEREEALENKVLAYIGKMSKAELQQTLIDVIFYGPEWQYEQFIRENGLDDW